MNILVLDTSTTACTVALLKADQVWCRHKVAPRQHSMLLLQMIDELCVEAGLTVAQLNLIAVGVGPGSFMGVRFAVSVAKSLAYTANLPMLGFSTLQLLAQTACQKYGYQNVVVGWDARMSEIYVGHYTLDKSGVMRPVISDALLKPASCDLSAQYAVGNAWDVYQDQLPHSFKNSLLETDSGLYPMAQAAQDWGFLTDSSLWLTPDQLNPHYFRGAVAN